jgi:ribosomal protein S2
MVNGKILLTMAVDFGHQDRENKFLPSKYIYQLPFRMPH